MVVFTFKYQILQLSSINNLNLKILVATSDVQNSPVFTDLQIQACKSFIALATGSIQTLKLYNIVPVHH